MMPKVASSFVRVVLGVQCVMMPGVFLMHRWYADNSDIPLSVSVYAFCCLFNCQVYVLLHGLLVTVHSSSGCMLIELGVMLLCIQIQQLIVLPVLAKGVDLFTWTTSIVLAVNNVLEIALPIQLVNIIVDTLKMLELAVKASDMQQYFCCI